MAEKGNLGDIVSFSGRLARTRTVTWAAIVLERLWPLVLPLLITVSLFLSLSWLGLFRLMPDTLRLIIMIGLGAVALGTLFLLRFFRAPTTTEIDRRIERANGLIHNPVSVQNDRLSSKGSPFADTLWREHQRRMADRLGALNSDLPRTRIPERDPWGLRALAALLLVTAFAFSFGPEGGRVADAFRAHAALDAVPPRIDAWVTPPTYTGKAPILLTGGDGNKAAQFTVPESSEVVLRVTGGNGDETLNFTDAAGNSRDIDPKPVAGASQPGETIAKQFAGKLERDGVLSLESNGRKLVSWSFSVIADKPPVIRFAGEPKRAVNGALELSYEVEDDYGPASAKVEFTLGEPQSRNARPLYRAPEMTLALPRRGAKGPAAKTSRDLTEHVWSGAAVTVVLKANDAAGQEGSSETKTFILPERPFTNPLARAVIEQRRVLALDANQKPRVLQLMDAITLRPEDTIKNMSHYLALVSAMTRLKTASSDDELRSVADYLWEIALGIENGDLSAAEKRLRQAQENLKQALENGASDEEIDKLMKELREAMNEFLREFAERAQRDPNLGQQMPQPGQELRQSDIDRMLDQIENLAKSGSRDKAQELLSQLQNMMNNLQAGRRQRGQNGQQNSEMHQRMDELGNIMRRQQEMMNETFRMDQMQRGQQRNGQGDQQQGQEGQGGQEGQQGQGGMTPEEFADALKQLQQGQGRLKGDLETLMKGLEGLGIQPNDGFGEAGEAMGQAEGALGEGESERATGEQGRALEALRRGAQDMMQQMQQAMQGDQGDGQEGGRQQSSDRDPLGRPRATTGPDNGDSTQVPDEIDVQRARQILEAIRKRLGDALSPELERSYLERLLELR